MGGRVLLLAAVVVLGSLVAAAGATAKGHYKFQGAPSGVEFKHGTAPILRPARRGAGAARPLVSCPQAQPSPSCNMTYHNGPLVITNTTHIIYWEPTGFSVSANYHSLTERYGRRRGR